MHWNLTITVTHDTGQKGDHVNGTKILLLFHYHKLFGTEIGDRNSDVTVLECLRSRVV